jgi:hypothetical protein
MVEYFKIAKAKIYKKENVLVYMRVNFEIMETRICSNGTNLYTSTTCKKSRAQRQI